MHVIKICLSLSHPLLHLITLGVVIPIGCILMLAFPSYLALFCLSAATVSSFVLLDLVA
jgi:hypothetical protein